MKMNIYIKYQSSYLPVYWIKRNNHNITGWFSGDMYKFMYFPNVKDIDIHFTYPKDGRLHYTIISNSSNLKERFFANNIEKNKLNKVGYILLNGKIINVFNHMLPSYTPPSYTHFSTSNKHFQFPMAAISFLNNKLYYPTSHKRNNIKQSSNNIVVDLNLHNNITINPCAILLGKDFDLPSFLAKTNLYILDDSSFPIIVLYVNISPKPN